MRPTRTIACLLFMTLCEVGVAQKHSNEPSLLKNTRQLTYEGRRAGEAYFSSDGYQLIFQSERDSRNPFFQIYRLSLRTGEIQRVSPGTGKTTCAFFHPHAELVLFASSHLDPQAEEKQKREFEQRATGKEKRYAWDYDPLMDIFTARWDGSQLKQVTNSIGYDAEASYSPDGKKIVFCSLRHIYAEERRSPEDQKRLEIDPAYYGEIYIMNADGSNQVRLTSTPGYDGGPFFTPDGQRIVWRRFEENGAIADVYTMALDGTDMRKLTDFSSMSWAPYFHPSGEYVIFASNKLGFSNFELYIVDTAGKHQPVRVSYADGFDGLPVFSPDGRRLCWTSNRTVTKQSQLFLADWDHEGARRALASAPIRKPTTADVSPSSTMPPTASSADGGDIALRGVPTSNEITSEDLQAEVAFLAADELAGRMTGTEGTRRAAEYIAQRLEEGGLQSVPNLDGFLQTFDFTSGMRPIDSENHLSISSGGSSAQEVQFKIRVDFLPLSFSADGQIAGSLVFAGYGLKHPGEIGVGYDSYSGLDVKDKIVLILRYVPEEVDSERRQQLNRYAGLRYKAMVAREQSAKAVLVVTGPNSPNAGKLVPLKYDNSTADSGIPILSVSGNVAEQILQGSGHSLKELQSGLDAENPHAMRSLSLDGVHVDVTISIERVKKKDGNVLAMLPSAKGIENSETIIVGAHYDHIGTGTTNSLAHKEEAGMIHNGADDNASGTAIILELAASLAEKRVKHPQKFTRNILFALWSGEELGLVGSSFFVQNSPFPLTAAAAYLNFDMVGRLRDNKLVLQGVGSSSAWRQIIERRNVVAGFDLTLQDDPYLPTDATSFYTNGVPVLSFFTGSHDDYHRPTDDADLINYEGAERIAKFAEAIILDLAKESARPNYVKVERSASQQGDRETLRAYLGTIPDYVMEGSSGVKLSGVRAGGPADKAGLQKGDIIVKFSGQSITNIYDYTYALDAVKIGEPIEVIVLRDGREVALMVTPVARE